MATRWFHRQNSRMACTVGDMHQPTFTGPPGRQTEGTTRLLGGRVLPTAVPVSLSSRRPKRARVQDADGHFSGRRRQKRSDDRPMQVPPFLTCITASAYIRLHSRPLGFAKARRMLPTSFWSRWLLSYTMTKCWLSPKEHNDYSSLLH
jgi:hypothetical protein